MIAPLLGRQPLPYLLFEIIGRARFHELTVASDKNVSGRPASIAIDAIGTQILPIVGSQPGLFSQFTVRRLKGILIGFTMPAGNPKLTRRGPCL